MNQAVPNNPKSEIIALLSPARVEIYRNFSKLNGGGENWLELYKKDIEIASGFYEKLHYLEVFLRNKIDVEFSKVFGENWILDDRIFPFLPRNFEKIRELNSNDRNAVISNLSLGFWAGLFHGFYHRKVWHKYHLLEGVFPHLVAQKRNIKTIEIELNKIRIFRNRVFHFESLINQNTSEIESLALKYLRGITKLEL